MDDHRWSRGLGWLSVGLGLTELTFAEGICRLFALPGRAGLVRMLGARELATGMGLLAQPERRPWVWGRVAGDAIDLSLLGATLNKPKAALGWRIAATVAVLGITLVDVFAASKPSVRRTARLGNLGDLEAQGGPAESWRGSGLAEDVHTNGQGAGMEASEEERLQRMRDAQEQLGLPDRLS